MKLNKIAASVIFLLFSVSFLYADVAEGEKLFKANCVSCHAIQDKVVGPALKDVSKRREEAWLLKWIKNSQALIKSGDATAAALFKEYNEVQMTPFETLKDGEIKSILEYIKAESDKPAAAATATAGNTGTAEVAEPTGRFSQTTVYLLLGIATVLIIALIILSNLKRSLRELYKNKFPEKYEADFAKDPSWRENRSTVRYKLFVKHPVVGYGLCTFALILVLSIWGFDYGNTKVGVQKNYMPTQPIAYSHELHAGKYKINCQYCHSGADKSKQATIPSASTCMNCHMHVTAKKENGKVSPEIQKIYDAVGWDADKKSYIPNYKQQPIKWVRVHNLPDHAYFNHAQHVKIGKVECQACHGPVETMKVVYQARSLQMGWCINCHREAKVDVANNGYYEKLHARVKAEGKAGVTVAENGGLECSKCHY